MRKAPSSPFQHGFAQEKIRRHAAAAGPLLDVAVDLGKLGFELYTVALDARMDRFLGRNQIGFIVGAHAKLAKKIAHLALPELGGKHALLGMLRATGLLGSRPVAVAEHEPLR
jgi:hypothetical protein